MLAMTTGGIIRKILVPRSSKCRWEVGGGVGRAGRAEILAGLFWMSSDDATNSKECWTGFRKMASDMQEIFWSEFWQASDGGPARYRLAGFSASVCLSDWLSELGNSMTFDEPWSMTHNLKVPFSWLFRKVFQPRECLGLKDTDVKRVMPSCCQSNKIHEQDLHLTSVSTIELLMHHLMFSETVLKTFFQASFFANYWHITNGSFWSVSTIMTIWSLGSITLIMFAELQNLFRLNQTSLLLPVCMASSLTG